ncbi:hypothetical protein HID58_011401 [Brassica napus]|uniref:MD-2-related lipid-recognition domain-containing protein n=1 Tax=Brassica napus TaxID=3708 RepID=A0ABQ8DY88_BRANA|nr:hypothetical protein HID58_011401 [Brassica napus]
MVRSYENYRVNVETVKISPYPVTRSGNADITITGYTARISDGSVVELTIAKASAGDPKTSSIKTYNLCDKVRCPIRPGRFSFTLSKIFSNEELKGRIYVITVRIKDAKDTNTNISDGATVTFSIWGYISDDRNYPLCDLVACPVAPGPLVFTLPNVFTEEELTRISKK